MKIYDNNVIKFPSSGFKLIIVIICVFGIIVPLFIQIFILLQQTTVKDESLLTSHKILYEDLEIKKEKVESLEKHLKELENIKIKALENLIQLDAKRENLQGQITQAKNEREDIKEQAKKLHKNVEKAKKELEYTQQAKIQKVVTNVVYIGVPQQRAHNFNQDNITDTIPHQKTCTVQQCFDFSKCSILNKFTFHLYRPLSEKLYPTYQTISSLEEYSVDWRSSCVILVMVDLRQGIKVIEKYLNRLPSWKNSHHNHLLILLSDDGEHYCETVKQLQVKHSMLAVNRFCNFYREGYDFLLINFDTLVIVSENAVPLYPLSRKYLLFFASQFLGKNRSNLIHEEYILELNATKDVFIKTKCDKLFWDKCSSTWCRCNLSPDWRKTFMGSSLFTLIIIDTKNPLFFHEIIDSFRCGSIPIFVGLIVNLPFSDVIDWKLASVIIPLQRLRELLLFLRSMPFNDVVSLKLQGQFLYTAYFSSKRNLISTLLTNLRSKIGLMPTGINDFVAGFVNGNTSRQPEMAKVAFSSPRFVHNFSYIGKNQYSSWNRYPGALRLYPVTPWNDPAPSTIQFLDEGKDFYMPIGDGTGGDGVAFSRSLGGDHPVEQFTILMLTYDREAILMEALQRLSGLKYLNKVIVVWNHPIDPAVDLEWPDIGVEIEVKPFSFKIC